MENHLFWQSYYQRVDCSMPNFKYFAYCTITFEAFNEKCFTLYTLIANLFVLMFSTCLDLFQQKGKWHFPTSDS